MAITHAAATRNSLADAVLADIGTSGKLKIYTAAKGTLLAELALSATAGTVSGAVLTYGSISDDASANATGTAAVMEVTTSADAEVYSGTVTATSGGGDLELDSLSITSGQTVSVSSMSYTASA